MQGPGGSRPIALFSCAPSGRFGPGWTLLARPPEGEQGAEPGGALGRIRVLPPNRGAEVKGPTCGPAVAEVGGFRPCAAGSAWPPVRSGLPGRPPPRRRPPRRAPVRHGCRRRGSARRSAGRAGRCPHRRAPRRDHAGGPAGREAALRSGDGVRGVPGGRGDAVGAGLGTSVLTAAIPAVLSAVNRKVRPGGRADRGRRTGRKIRPVRRPGTEPFAKRKGGAPRPDVGVWGRPGCARGVAVCGAEKTTCTRRTPS